MGQFPLTLCCVRVCVFVHTVLTRRRFIRHSCRRLITLDTFSCCPSGGKMNPNDQYFQQQQQPGYGAPPLGQNYGGGMMPPRTPVMQTQPQQFPPANGPHNMNPYGQPSPRPPMAQYGHSPLPPPQANPNQLAQQMGGMNLADNSLKSPVPQMYPPINGNASPAYPRPPMGPSNLPPMSQTRPGMMPPMQQPMGPMSPQPFQNGPGEFLLFYTIIHLFNRCFHFKVWTTWGVLQ